LPFQGHRSLRGAATAHVGRMTGRVYDPDTECVSVAGGLNGVLNALLATVEPRWPGTRVGQAATFKPI
jgi:aspartate/methionine/tyrosine aminotransferase